MFRMMWRLSNRVLVLVKDNELVVVQGFIAGCEMCVVHIAEKKVATTALRSWTLTSLQELIVILSLDDIAVWILECDLAHQVLVGNAFRDVTMHARHSQPGQTRHEVDRLAIRIDQLPLIQ